MNKTGLASQACIPPQRLDVRHQGGFSLVELLVVIAVCVVLMGILVPTVSSVRKYSQASACASNLGQVGQAIHLYALDHNQVLPGPLWQNQYACYSRAGDGHLPSYLYRYLDGPEPDGEYRFIEVFLCPAWKGEVNNPYQTTPRQTVLKVNQSNTLPDGSRGSPFGYPNSDQTVWRISQFDEPGDYPILCDTDLSSPARLVHDDFRNTLFLDGHVEAIGEDSTRRVYR